MAEQVSKLVQIKKTGGLGKIKDSKGNPIKPMLYLQKGMNREEDGELQGEYKGSTLLDAKQGLCPHWDSSTKSWCWGSTPERLIELIGKMKLRYPINHQNEGQFIQNTETAESRLSYFYDDVFRHPSFYGSFFMQDGRLNFDMNNPAHEFLHHCYTGNVQVRDKGSDKVLNKYIAGSIKYEMTSPKAENVQKKRLANKEMTAMKLLIALDGDTDRMRSVAQVMRLPGYSKHTDGDGVFILLKDMAAQNLETTSKYGGKSYQERFIEVASMPKEDLEINKTVIEGLDLGIIRTRGANGFLLNGEKVSDGAYDDVKIIAFFRSDENQNYWTTLVDLIDNHSNI